MPNHHLTRHDMQTNGQPLIEDIRRLGVFYEVHADLTVPAESTVETWFEIALHVELDEFQPPGHPKNREALSVLMDLADLLIQRIQSHAPYRLEMPASYHTLHPPDSGRPAPRLARTISLVFFDVGSVARYKEPNILARLRTELALLGVAHFSCGGQCQ